MHEAAVRLLARREHSASELAAKLRQRGFAEELVDEEIAGLAAAGLQADGRFAEQFVDERVRRGDGPNKIRSALAERGVADELIRAALAPFAEEWPERARAALAKRFGEKRAFDRREQTRRARFLQTRGFPAEITRSVVMGDDEE